MAVGVDVAMLGWLFGQVGWNGGRAALGILVATALALLPSASLATLHRLPARTTILTRGEVGVLEHLRQEAPLDAVVAHVRGASRSELRSPTGLHPMPLVAAFAGRRTVLEYYRPDVDPSVNRLRALRRLFATQDASQGESLLDRFDADYVLEYRFLPLHFQSPRLHLAYQRDEVRLWRVARDASSARPGPRFATPGLR